MSTPGRPRPRSRLLLALFLAPALVATVLVGLGARAVWRPALDMVPTRADPVDALLVLGPLEPWRVSLAEQYMREGRAHNLVLSTPNMPWDAEYCHRRHPWPAHCFAPDPSTTRGEAMGLDRLARQHGWTSLAVLTVDFHVERARFIFERCLRTDVPVFGRHVALYREQAAYQVLRQGAGYAKELVLGPCPR